jgi:hypothetical protein
MADLEHIKGDIAGIAARPKGVTFSEIERIVKQLKAVGYSARYYKGDETWVFYVSGEKFTICDHHRGSQHIKPFYIKKFLGAMINLGLYEG